MKLKICGITNQKDLEICAKYADAVGFIVEYPQSPRSISIEKAKKLMKHVPPFITGVVVIPDFKKAGKIYSKLKPGVIQLHGKETPEDVKKFRDKVDCKIIKACGVESALKFGKYADVVLIDSKYSEVDLNKVGKIIKSLNKPVILAGNITHENVLDVLAKVEPYAIDVASGVEIRPGKKDPEKIKRLRKKLELGKTVGSIIKSKSNIPSFGFYEKLSSDNGLKLITEIKPASPSEGKLRSVSNLKESIKAMERGGASAISVLVEEEKFGGSLELLKKVRKFTALPILAKGFFFEPRQIAEIATAGANAFLLMARVVEAQGASLKDLIDTGAALGMDVVVEVTSQEELGSAMVSGANILEVNNRDIYGDLRINLENVILGQDTPSGIVLISASGINSAEDIQSLYKLSKGRVNAFLVGTSIMKSKNIQAKVQELTKACREVAK